MKIQCGILQNLNAKLTRSNWFDRDNDGIGA